MESERRQNLLALPTSLCVFISLFALSLPSSRAICNKPYRAAVYEHAVLPAPPKVVSRAEAVENMMKNVRIYEAQTKIAAKKGANIIVFPEYGIIGLDLNRTTVKSYLEEVPDPQCVSWNPSESPNAYKRTDIQRQLSRIAKENKIFMVVNMGTKVPCKSTDDPTCPTDGQYQYNTNVVYSDNGTLVAFYHKRNLYIDLPFNPARVPEYVTFETPFGRFGTVVCFDLMFKEPTLNLIEKHKVRNIAYPTAWVKIIPFYRSLMVHSGFAKAFGINLLASNLHFSYLGAHGSGIYTPTGAQAYFYDRRPRLSKLLISDVNAIDEETPIPESTIPPQITPDKNISTIKGSVLGQDIWFRLLSGTNDTINICDGDFCCSLEYEYQQTQEKYALGVSNGFLHINGRKLYSQSCSLSKCIGNSCDTDITEAHTIFKRFLLSGHNFKSTYISTQVVAMNGSSFTLVEGDWTHAHTGQIHMRGTMSLPLHSAVITAHVYDKDVIPHQDVQPEPPKCIRSGSSSSAIKSTCTHHFVWFTVLLSLLSALS